MDKEYVVRDMGLAQAALHARGATPGLDKSIKVAQHELLSTPVGSGGSFQSRLWQLITHADLGNLERLAKAFPLEVAVYQSYRTGLPVHGFLVDYGYAVDA